MSQKKKLKRITQKELKKLRFETTKKGFTLWGENNIWILDGSTLMEDGNIYFCNRKGKNIKVEIEDSNEWLDFVEIILKK